MKYLPRVVADSDGVALAIVVLFRLYNRIIKRRPVKKNLS